MSALSTSIGVVLAHINRACQHDINRWQLMLDLRKARGEGHNPDCLRCQDERRRANRRRQFGKLGRGGRS